MFSRARAAILDWLGVPLALTDATFWTQWINSQSSAGQTINENTVMSLSAAWACTRLVAETIATLPLHLYERTPTGGRKVANQHPVWSLLHYPNAKSTATTFWESVVASMLLRGNAFIEAKKSAGKVVALHFLVPGRISHSVGSTGTQETWYTELHGLRRRIYPENLIHIPAFSLDGKYGLSAIQYGAGVFGSALAANEAANGTFERGLMPTVAYKMQQTLKAEQRAEFRANLAAITGALNAGKSPLLEGGMDAMMIGINPNDAQLLESRGYSVEEVCRWFRVDPSMVGHGNKDSNWGTGLEQKLIGFLTFTLRPWLTRVEQAINMNLLSPAERTKYYAEYSIEGLLRADSAARSAFYSVMVNNGIFTRDEVRALENRDLMGGNAAVLTVQTAMAPLDSLGVQRDGDTARAALASWLKGLEQTDE